MAQKKTLGRKGLIFSNQQIPCNLSVCEHFSLQALSVTIVLINFIQQALVNKATHGRGESDRVHSKGSHRSPHGKKKRVVENHSRPRNVRNTEEWGGGTDEETPNLKQNRRRLQPKKKTMVIIYLGIFKLLKVHTHSHTHQ